MQNKTMDMRRTALKLLIAKHRSEFRELQEYVKERLKTDEPFRSTENIRNAARNTAESELVKNHFIEFREIHDQVKMLNGQLSGIDLLKHKIQTLWSHRTRDQIITQSMDWPVSYARQMLRRKYREEYKAIIKAKRNVHGVTQANLYASSTNELVSRHRRDYDRFRQQCRTAIINLLNELEREQCQANTQVSELSLGSGTK